MLADWSLAVKKRDGWCCVKCGSPHMLNSHHIFKRAYLNTRYDVDNGITLCQNCHTESVGFSAHKTIIKFREWLIARNGQSWYDELKRKADTISYGQSI